MAPVGRPRASAQRALPLLLVAAAVACVLIALRLIPAIPLLADVGPQPAVIVNDYRATVVVRHCAATCATTTGVATLPAGRELKAGAPSSDPWLIEDSSGRPIGCLTVTAAGQRLSVSHAGSCPETG